AVQTDDRMALEFSGPRALNNRTVSTSNAEDLLALRAADAGPDVIRDAWRTAGASQWRNRAAMLLQAESYEPAYQNYLKALDLEPTNAAALDGFVIAAIASNRQLQAVDKLRAS